MRKTKDERTAMLRLADVLGWEIEQVAPRSTQWQVTHPPCAVGLTYSIVGLLCYMARVAMSPTRWGGEGLTKEDLMSLILFTAHHNYNAKDGQYYLGVDGKIDATEETTMYAAFYYPEGMEYV